MSAPDANAPSTTPSIGTWSMTADAPATLSADIAASRVSLAATVSRSAGRRRPTATSMPLQQSIRCGRKRPCSGSSAMRSTTYSSQPPGRRRLSRAARRRDGGIDDDHEHGQAQRGEALELQRVAIARPGDADDRAGIGRVDGRGRCRASRTPPPRPAGSRRRRAPTAAAPRSSPSSPGSPHTKNLNGRRAPAWTAPALSDPRSRSKTAAADEAFTVRFLPRPGKPGYVRPRASLSGSSV